MGLQSGAGFLDYKVEQKDYKVGQGLQSGAVHLLGLSSMQKKLISINLNLSQSVK